MNKAIVTLALLACATLTGCVTATGYAQRTNKDGTTSKAKYTLFGAGATASQAIKGLAIDGDSEAPGVALQEASNAQDSTAALQALVQLGSILAPLINKGGAANVPLTSASNKETSAENTIEANSTASPVPSAPKSITGTNGTATVAILGNRTNCAYCRRLWAGLDAATLSADLCGATITDADKTDNPAVYVQLRPKQAFDYPLVLVYSADGSLAGQFVARNYTQAALEAKVKALVPSCNASGIATQ